MAITIRVEELLNELERTFYWLAKEYGVSHTTLWRLKKDKAQGITFNTLEKICEALECEPGDILAVRVKPEIEARIREKAAERGLPVEKLLQAAIETESQSEMPFSETATPKEWEAALDEFIHDAAFQNISWAVDDSRESIYREREDAQL